MLLTLALAGRPPCSWGWGARSWAQSGTSGVLTCAGASLCRLERERWDMWSLLTVNIVSIFRHLHQGFITKLIGKRRKTQTKNPSKVSIPSDRVFTLCWKLMSCVLTQGWGWLFILTPVIPLSPCVPVSQCSVLCDTRLSPPGADTARSHEQWLSCLG